MIRVDDRVGSKDLVDYMPKGAAQIVRLPYGDAEFTTEAGLLIGFEVKTLGDLLNCISTGRFGGRQLPGMTCRYSVAYLLIEGPFRAADDGVLVIPRRGGWVPVELAGRRYMWSDLERWITTIEVYAGLRVRRTRDRAETAAMVYQKWLWWGKGDHHAHRVFDESLAGPMPLREPSVMRYIASRLPGIGWVKSQAVERKFRSPLEMAMAPEGVWREIDGVGPKLAKQIVSVLRGEQQ